MNFKISWLEILLLICVLTYCGDSLRTSVWSEINFLIIDSGFESKLLTLADEGFLDGFEIFDPFYNKWIIHKMIPVYNHIVWVLNSGLIPRMFYIYMGSRSMSVKCDRNRCVQFVRIRTGVVEYVCNTLMLVS